MTVSVETVHMAKSWPQKNQSECSYLPCHVIINYIKRFYFPAVFFTSATCTRLLLRNNYNYIQVKWSSVKADFVAHLTVICGYISFWGFYAMNFKSWVKLFMCCEIYCCIFYDLLNFIWVHISDFLWPWTHFHEPLKSSLVSFWLQWQFHGWWNQAVWCLMVINLTLIYSWIFTAMKTDFNDPFISDQFWTSDNFSWKCVSWAMKEFPRKINYFFGFLWN